MKPLVFSSFLVVALSGFLHSEDWPQFLGPGRDGRSAESIQATYDREGPRRLWKISVGQGFSGPIAVTNRVFLFHRVGSEEILEAFDSESGKSVWKQRSEATYRDDFGFDEGPRSTPTWSDGQLFALGADGHLICVNAGDGHRIWEVSARRELGADKGFFGFACSPLIEGKYVIVQLGGRDNGGIVAFDRTDGTVAWKATDHEAGYASPIAATVGGQRLILCFTRAGLVELDPATGRVKGTFPWRSRQHASVNAASPLFENGRVFLTSSYDTGAALVKVDDGKLRLIWSGDESLSSHYTTPVFHDGSVYGFHGRQEQRPTFRCVELESGKVHWEEKGLGAGNLLAAADSLVLVLESGELLVAKASPSRFEVKYRGQILGSGVRAVPALARHHLYARDPRNLIALDMGSSTAK